MRGLVACLTVGEVRNSEPSQGDGWREGTDPVGPVSAPPTAPAWTGEEQPAAPTPYPAVAYPSGSTGYDPGAYDPQALSYPQEPAPPSYPRPQPDYGAPTQRSNEEEAPLTQRLSGTPPAWVPAQPGMSPDQGIPTVAATPAPSTSAHPVSGGPSDYYGVASTSGAPASGALPVSSFRPSYEDAIDPLATGGANWQPRIVPSPPKKKGQLLIGLAIGLLAGLLVFGATGFFVGRGTAPKAGPATAPTPTGQPNASLPPFEQSQLTLNQSKFTPELAKLAQAWLPRVGGCLKNGDQDGPTLAAGEAIKVWCRLGALNIYFVAYSSLAERDKARILTSAQSVDAPVLTPGAAPVGTRTTPSGRSSGNYVEYAYRVRSDAKGRVVAGLWWDDVSTPVAAYVRGYWIEAMGQSWEPVRDLWQRYS